MTARGFRRSVFNVVMFILIKEVIWVQSGPLDCLFAIIGLCQCSKFFPVRLIVVQNHNGGIDFAIGVHLVDKGSI